MSILLDREIAHLKKKLLSFGAMVEEAIARAIHSLEKRDDQMAWSVIDNDDVFDTLEIEIEEDCLKILALHQPVAADLRFVICVLKMNNDLERMGDLAAKIARRGIFLTHHPRVDIGLDFKTMAMKSQNMVKKSLDALVNYDSRLARDIRHEDDEVDQMRDEFDILIEQALREMPEHSETLLQMASITRHLERLADMATSVAEDVIYMVEGEIIRHERNTTSRSSS